VGTGQVALVRAFPEYARITGRGESDICFDGGHFVLVGDDHDVFVYDLASGVKGAVLDVRGHPFDSVYITADDEVTVTWLSAGRGRYQGIELFDREMRFQRQVARAGGHMDVSRDVDGEAVLVWANGGDPEPICDNGIVKIRLRDGQQTCLLTLDVSLAAHVSASDEGWAIVSTFAPQDPRPEGGWPPYTNEIVRVKLDGSVVSRLAHHRSRPSNDYNWQPKATISRDGTRIVYASNFGLPETAGYPAQYSDAYLIRLDEDLGASGCHPRPEATARAASPELAFQLMLAGAPVGAIVVVGRRFARRGRRPAK
jgi:hypothetical protein